MLTHHKFLKWFCPFDWSRKNFGPPIRKVHLIAYKDQQNNLILDFKKNNNFWIFVPGFIWFGSCCSNCWKQLGLTSASCIEGWIGAVVEVSSLRNWRSLTTNSRIGNPKIIKHKKGKLLKILQFCQLKSEECLFLWHVFFFDAQCSIQTSPFQPEDTF